MCPAKTTKVITALKTSKRVFFYNIKNEHAVIIENEFLKPVQDDQF